MFLNNFSPGALKSHTHNLFMLLRIHLRYVHQAIISAHTLYSTELGQLFRSPRCFLKVLLNSPIFWNGSIRYVSKMSDAAHRNLCERAIAFYNQKINTIVLTTIGLAIYDKWHFWQSFGSFQVIKYRHFRKPSTNLAVSKLLL